MHIACAAKPNACNARFFPELKLSSRNGRTDNNTTEVEMKGRTGRCHFSKKKKKGVADGASPTARKPLYYLKHGGHDVFLPPPNGIRRSQCTQGQPSRFVAALGRNRHVGREFGHRLLGDPRKPPCCRSNKPSRFVCFGWYDDVTAAGKDSRMVCCRGACARTAKEQGAISVSVRPVLGAVVVGVRPRVGGVAVGLSLVRVDGHQVLHVLGLVGLLLTPQAAR